MQENCSLILQSKRFTHRHRQFIFVVWKMNSLVKNNNKANNTNKTICMCIYSNISLPFANS